MFGVRVVPAHAEPRNGSNNSEHGSTSGHPTAYGSGHLIPVFRDTGRIFSLLLPSRPSTSLIGHSLKNRVQSRRRNMVSSEAKNGFNCVSCGTHEPPSNVRADISCPACLCPFLSCLMRQGDAGGWESRGRERIHV
jgi:hypothetical protein